MNLAATSRSSGSLVKRAIDTVSLYIRDNALRVGDSVPSEGFFAAQMGVSRQVMREAFGALAALGLIDVGNGRLPRVAAIDGSVIAASLGHALATAQVSIAEVWDVRRVLEARSAALAAINRTDDQATEIVGLAEQIALARDDLEVVTRHDVALHQAIARASRNALLAQIVSSFGPLMEVAVPAAWKTRTTTEQREAMVHRHRVLSRAIADRDAHQAAIEMSAHFDASVGDLLGADLRGDN